MQTIISGKQFDAERALYHLQNAAVCSCVFAGPADGESALKEAANISVENCRFSLRYPLWHVKNFSLTDSSMDELTRAALWYSDNGTICHCKLGGIKALRECHSVTLSGCTVTSPEFGWKCDSVTVENCDITSEYLFLDSRNIRLEQVHMQGKYSFQYIENLEITDSVLDTKDAFWHAKNVTVRNSVVKGEYLGWFSEGLTLIDCQISGTQPLCYCKDLKLIHCEMENCDLAFEYSNVYAEITGHVDSVKNPRSGKIILDHVGEIIREDPVMPCAGEVIVRAGANRL